MKTETAKNGNQNRKHPVVTALLTATACAVLSGCSSTQRPSMTIHQQGVQRGSVGETTGPAQPSLARPTINYAKLPLSFELNQGQSDPQVKFLARAKGYTLFLTPTESVMTLVGGASDAQHKDRSTTHVVRMKLVGASVEPKVVGVEKMPGIANYFIGNDPAKWHTEIPTFTKVKYENVYPGVDLVYYGNQGQVEHDFVLAPGADPNVINVAFEGADRMETNPQGELVLHTAAGELRCGKPQIYQEVDGVRRPIAGNYALNKEPNVSVVGFEVAHYDPSKTLVIDPPILVYSTFVGGSGADEGNAIAVDANGNIYVAGATGSAAFPLAPQLNPLFRNLRAVENAFVLKLNANGAPVYSTYLGGTGFESGPPLSQRIGDEARGIAVNVAGEAYVTGATFSRDFPVTNAFQQTIAGGSDAFVTKLNSIGSRLLYSTYLGGDASDGANAIATRRVVSGSGSITNEAYVAGATGDSTGSDFPIRGSGVFQRTIRGDGDAFVAKIVDVSSGSGVLLAPPALQLSTFLGGSDLFVPNPNPNFPGSFVTDRARAIAVDSQGQVYVTGETASSDFPIVGAFQPSRRGGLDAFVTQLSSDFKDALYSTYLGGISDDVGNGIAVDAAGQMWVAGFTESSDFPRAKEIQNQRRGRAAFVTGFRFFGGAPFFSTFLDGGTSDTATAIAVNANGVFVTGSTDSGDFPTNAPVQPTLGLDPSSQGTFDAFVTQIIPPSETTLRLGGITRTISNPARFAFSTFLGGSAADSGHGIALDANSNIYVTGATSSGNFPTASPFFSLNSGGGDVFVAKISGAINTGSFDLVPSEAAVAVHEPFNYAFTWTVPAPLNWHDLQFLQLRIRDGDDVIFSLLFDEASQNFVLLNEATGAFINAGVAGQRKPLQTPEATLYLADSRVVGSGPAGPSVTLNLSLSFKPQAAGRTFVVEVAASDDLGNHDDFIQAGTLTVTPSK